MVVLWVDMLCFRSAIKASLGINRSADKINYINIHKNFKPFVGIMSKILNKPIVQVLDVVESEERIGNKSLFEIIQDRLSLYLTTWISDRYMDKKIVSFIDRTGFSLIKYREHLKELAYVIVYRPVEMQVLAQKLSNNDNNLFLLKSTPLETLVKDILGGHNVSFYSFFSFSDKLIENREKYYYDEYTNGKYYTGTLNLFIEFFFKKWLVSCLASTLFLSRKRENIKKNNIGVELIQGKIRRNNINDIYWLKESNINPITVQGISFVDYDEQSLSELKESGVKPIVIADNYIKHMFNISSYNRNSYEVISVSPMYLAKTLIEVIKLFLCVFQNKFDGWFHLHSGMYYLRSKFWQEIYLKLGISMLWTMYDVDPEKLIKAQALESIKGLYIGSHWSNYYGYMVMNQKCYDIIFPWSGHFIKNNFSNYKFTSAFQVGYPLDFCFDEYKRGVDDIKKSLRDKFIITFYDNMGSNDIEYSIGIQIKVCSMLVDIINTYREVVVFFKPKRESTFDSLLENLPILKHFIAMDRIRVFAGKANTPKVLPIKVGVASDITIGVGISTAVAESCFAGTVGFHVDLTGFENNAFGNACLNKVVFRDISSLKKAVIDQINGRGVSIDECKKYHKILDPFQDGLSYKRTGYIIKMLQDALSSGVDKEEAISKVKDNISRTNLRKCLLDEV